MSEQPAAAPSQRQIVENLLRNSPFDIGGEILEQREIYRQMMSGLPVPDDVTARPGELGGVPVVTFTTHVAAPDMILLYLHGGAYAFGAARDAAGLACGLARPARATVVSVDYRLAPEHPFPAAVDDVVSVYHALRTENPSATIAFAGESAGGGLALSTLLALKESEEPQPAAALLLSPWLDLTVPAQHPATGTGDMVLTTEGLRTRALDYLGGADTVPTAVDPLNADLTGLAPLHIQAGSSEILLADALRLAARAAEAHVPVELRISAHMQHVFHNFAGLLDEADAAIRAAGDFLSTHRPVPSAPRTPTPDYIKDRREAHRSDGVLGQR
ncbi:alpha/beta hydrolase fold domain-containing protein [Streptomyces bluensis]|uniref:alpha/beta hydrolase fold domain-containing protein n=1 Tax=Streptomyces bluensis TaxID=33897 RepID=UPI0036A4EE0A